MKTIFIQKQQWCFPLHVRKVTFVYKIRENVENACKIKFLNSVLLIVFIEYKVREMQTSDGKSLESVLCWLTSKNFRHPTLTFVNKKQRYENSLVARFGKVTKHDMQQKIAQHYFSGYKRQILLHVGTNSRCVFFLNAQNK